MRGAAFEPVPRDEERIVRDGRKSGLFPKQTASKRAALMRHFAIMQANAEVRALQERRRYQQDAQRTQMDYERVVGDQAASTIPPLRTFNHQMNNRRAMANAVNDATGMGRSDRERARDAGGGNVFDFM